MTGSVVVLTLMLFGLNLFTFLVFAYDKACAVRGAWRIPERQLFSLMTLGGSIGGWMAMLCLHHKNRKTTFRVVATIIVCGQLLLLLLLHQWIAIAAPS